MQFSSVVTRWGHPARVQSTLVMSDISFEALPPRLGSFTSSEHQEGKGFGRNTISGVNARDPNLCFTGPLLCASESPALQASATDILGQISNC